MALDPVCGHDVDPLGCAGRSEYFGEVFYFCSAECKAMFDEEPEIYAEFALEEY